MMQLKYKSGYCYYLINRNIPYYDFSIYRLPDGFKGRILFGLFLNGDKFQNILSGIKVQ